jgi:hypothetical protein
MDRRDYAALYDRFPGDYDAEREVFVIEFDPPDDAPEDAEPEVVEVPIRFEVCETCDGRGKHVNPSIDAHGIGAEEWEQEWDEEERESYFRGGYDIRCNECSGRRVVPVPNLGSLDETCRKRVQERIESHEQHNHEMAAERRYFERMGGY